MQKYLLAKNAKQDDIQAYSIKIMGGTHTQDPIYPEGHPKRIDNEKNDPPEVQEEEALDKCKRYNREGFVAN